ncbi:hypothetical protein NMG60_11006229, partial [Bertholletia excelsa]
RLSKPLVRDDGRIYSCSSRNLFAFESNGSIAWTVNLNYICNAEIAPVHGGSRKIFLVAENRVLRINPLNIGTSESAVDVFFGPEPGEEEGEEITGIAVSTLSSSVFINIKNRGLFAYRFQGQLLWSAGPVLYQFGYRQGCRRNDRDCYFTSTPVIDQCEASVYISNTEGELYALSVRSPHFKWIQDFSSLDKSFIITPGNNGRLYVTVPIRALVLALDVFNGTVLWQRRFGPLSTPHCAPVVDSNGWISIGSSDGFLYSFSPTGVVKRFPKADSLESVIQVSPLVDCSGYAVYISQTEMEGKTSHSVGEYTYISAMKPRYAVFVLLAPATGAIYWSERYNGQISTILSESDLRHFVLDETTLLAFVAASKIGNPLPCRSTRQKLASSCAEAEAKHVSIYTGNERAILLFLLLESAVLIILFVAVRFCCIFWRKKKLRSRDLGTFLEKRRSLQVQKKAFDRHIAELENRGAEKAIGNEMIELLGNLVREREGIERKLSTTYSLGRDRPGSKLKILLPLYNGKTRSYSFQCPKKENVTIFHTLSDTSSENSSSEKEAESNFFEGQQWAIKAKIKAKGKAPFKVGGSSEDEINEDYGGTSLGSDMGSEGFLNPSFLNQGCDEPDNKKMNDEGALSHKLIGLGRTMSLFLAARK